MKRLLRLAALAALVALATMLAAIPAWAVYTPVIGDNTTMNFNQYVIVDSDARVPAVTFTYRIIPGAAVAADADNHKPAVLAGVGTPTVGNAAFTSNQTAFDEVQSGDNLTLASGKKYAKQTVNVNFSNVSFSQPGIYRYVLEAQTSDANKAVAYDTQVGSGNTAGIRYIDVYVVDNNGSLSVSEYVMHTTTEVAATSQQSGDVSDKSTSIVNTVTSYDVSFGKEVTGNQGSKDKYFKFVFSIDTAQAYTGYEVDIRGADAEPHKTDATKYETSQMSNPAVITTDENGRKQTAFYLKDGQYITVKGLPAGCHYALTEDAEDYTSTGGISAINNAGNTAYPDPTTDATSGPGLNGDIMTGYTNDRSGTVPTGVIIAVAPFAVGLVGFGAAAAVLASRKNQDEEE